MQLYVSGLGNADERPGIRPFTRPLLDRLPARPLQAQQGPGCIVEPSAA